MIDELLALGIREIDIKNIGEFINEDNKEDSMKIINLLENIGCDEKEIRNIIVGNPHILEMGYEEVFDLINYMINAKFNNLNILFDSYPVFLNKDKWEIENYINKKLQENMNIEDIISDLEFNPLLIEEI